MEEGRGDWVRRIEAARALDELTRIEADLADLGPDWLGPLRFQIGACRARLRHAGKASTGSATMGATGTVAASAMASTNPAKTDFAGRYGLPAPDGRSLHAYRLGDRMFEALQRDVSGGQGLAVLQQGHQPGLFVLWASEWFRRCYGGGTRRWEKLTGVLGLPNPGQSEQHALRAITRTGLGQWSRPVIADGNTSYYLATLAREGGFPAHAVADGAKGWARTILAAVVGPLVGRSGAGEAEALELAAAQKSALPGVFRDDDFVQLCADLALAIVRIRQSSDHLARAAGLPLTAWLALHQPDWRDSLPLTSGDAAADGLIETLMQVEAVSSTHVGVERLFLRDGERRWQEAVRLALDGPLSGGTMAQVDAARGRLRAFAAGPMARYIPGELALFDPPCDGDNTWTARSARAARGLLLLPFAAAVRLDLRAGDHLLARIDLPGGKPRRGQLLVAELDRGSIDAPEALRIIGSGSGSYRAAELYVHAPSDWTALADNGGAAIAAGPGVGDNTLWRITGGARFTDSMGDTYRVLCGQASDAALRIELTGQTPGWADVTGSVDLFLGPPLVPRNRGGELVWRPIGQRAWRPAPGALPLGHYELGWRRDGDMLDRRRIAVLPPEAAVRTDHLGGGVEYTISGFAPATVRPVADSPVVATSDGARWVQRPTARAVHRFVARIEWPGCPALEVGIGYPGEASIARWDGTVLSHGSILTLADLRDLVGIDRGEMTLLAELRDSQHRERAEMSWTFTHELPLSAIAGDIASLLLPASIDAEVVLSMHNGINTTWRVRQFPLTLIKEGSGFVASAAIADEGVMLRGRAITAPLHEVSFGPYSLLSEANHRPVQLPDEAAGDWLVFLRSGDRVLTRPLYIRCGGLPEAPTGLLARAMAEPFGARLTAALIAVLDCAAGDGEQAQAAQRELLALIGSLRGLPPSTFEVLKLLAAHPNALARLAFGAVDADRDAVIGLAQALPFTWFTVPRAAWDQARGHAFARLLSDLAVLEDQAAGYAMQALAGTTAALVEREPLLAAVLSPSAAAGDRVADATMRFLQRGAIDRVRGPSWGRYREVPGLSLPAEFLQFNPCVLDTLDAPCAAAAAVIGRWTPNAAQIRHIKLIARTFPTWFSEAFAASLKEHF